MISRICRRQRITSSIWINNVGFRTMIWMRSHLLAEEGYPTDSAWAWQELTLHGEGIRRAWTHHEWRIWDAYAKQWRTTCLVPNVGLFIDIDLFQMAGTQVSQQSRWSVTSTSLFSISWLNHVSDDVYMGHETRLMDIVAFDQPFWRFHGEI